MRREKIYELTLYSMFVAIIFLLSFTRLGFIVIPVLGIGLTTVQIPVIIGSYNLGVRGGAILGAFFGLGSLICCFTTPDLIANVVLGTSTGFGLYNLFLIVAILFVPRILCGVFAALTYKGISKFDRSNFFAMAISAFVGSITNTIFVLGGFSIFAFDGAVALFGLSETPTFGAIITALRATISFNGVIEAIAAVIVCTVVGQAIYVARKKKIIK